MSDFDYTHDAELRRRIAEGDYNERRRAELADRAKRIPGPLGDLPRTVAEMHADWLDTEQLGAVTEAESIRMEEITNAAVDLVDWLEE